MHTRIAIVIVMYNEWCGDSETCKTVLRNSRQPDVVLVVDNSTRDMQNEVYCQNQGWLYHSMGGNAGLPKAYNAAARIVRDKSDLIVWADDDTCFPDHYFEEIDRYVQNSPKTDVFLPVVRTKSFIMSPAIYTQRRILPIKSLDELPGKEWTAINSGLAARSRIYDSYRYDESIFLDCVDHDFMRWCRMNGKQFLVMDRLELMQSFFSEGKPSAKSRITRAKIYSKDTRVFDAKCGKSRLLAEWDLFRHWTLLLLSCAKNSLLK